LIIALFFAHPTFGQGLQEVVVKRWIAASIEAHRVADNNLDQTIGRNLSVDQLQTSWRALKACRDAGNSLDLNLAAAEHYMFMRFVASKSGDTGYRALPKWYETVKRAATKADLERILPPRNLYLRLTRKSLNGGNAELSADCRNTGSGRAGSQARACRPSQRFLALHTISTTTPRCQEAPVARYKSPEPVHTSVLHVTVLQWALWPLRRTRKPASATGATPT
jgi:hypothetical protein